MVKKTETIEELAVMVQKGFLDVHEKMDKNFEDVQRQIKSIDAVSEERTQDLESQMKAGFDHTEKRFDHVEARLSIIERDIAEIRKYFVYRDEFENLMNRVKYLEGKLGVVGGK